MRQPSMTGLAPSLSPTPGPTLRTTAAVQDRNEDVTNRMLAHTYRILAVSYRILAVSNRISTVY